MFCAKISIFRLNFSIFRLNFSRTEISAAKPMVLLGYYGGPPSITHLGQTGVFCGRLEVSSPTIGFNQRPGIFPIRNSQVYMLDECRVRTVFMMIYDRGQKSSLIEQAYEQGIATSWPSDRQRIGRNKGMGPTPSSIGYKQGQHALGDQKARNSAEEGSLRTQTKADDQKSRLLIKKQDCSSRTKAARQEPSLLSTLRILRLTGC